MVTRPEPLGFSALFKRLGRRLSGKSGEPRRDDDVPDEVGSSDQIARQVLALMLEEAVDVLKALDLPFRPGFYRWNPHQMEWGFLSSAMTPAERWAMVLEAPAGEGWRYATLPQVVRGERPDDDAVRRAADVLEQGVACRQAAEQGGSGNLEAVVKLAVAWADFQVARTVPAGERRGPLKLYFPPEDLDIPVDLPAPETLKPARASKGSGRVAARRARKPGAGA
jgi:hypothetical protein